MSENSPESPPVVDAANYDILGRLPQALLIVDAQSRIRIWNAASVLLFGWTEQEIALQPTSVLPTERHDELRSLMEQVLRGETPRSQEMRRRKKDGALLDLRVSAAPLRDSHRSLTGAALFFSDITDYKLLEAQFLQLQKMEAMSRLTGGIAHDFNNLLTVILGRSEFVLNSTPLTEGLREDVNEIKKAAERAADLTRQLLEFSRKQPHSTQVLDVNAIVRGMERMLRRLLGEDIQLVTQLSEEVGPVRVDPGHMEQVILNLAVNARDAMAQGGQITIQTGRAKVNDVPALDQPEIQPGIYSAIAVTDTGCGMEEDVKTHLFQPFFTTKDRSKGTGLGLATVYGIVKQSGGHITVATHPGQGTTFRIYLPEFEGQPASAEQNQRTNIPGGGPETILVVEDENVVRDLIVATLQAQGYNVLAAACAQDAQRAAQQYPGPIHLLMTDVVLPDLNGLELAHRIVSLRPQIKVLYTSGYGSSVIVRLDRLRTDAPFLPKPFTPMALGFKVREVLQMESGSTK
jgi:PAS domain S-box-containing protein